jgi:hypothetical protein
MFIDRNERNLISECEAKALYSTIHDSGGLVFPVSPAVVGAIIGTYACVQKMGGSYRPSFTEKIMAKVNYSYASVASFILWLGVRNVVLSPISSGTLLKGGIMVKLQSSNQIEWDALKAAAFRAPLI